MIGAQTSGNFARRAIRYFFADELDKWPVAVGREGDGFSLGPEEIYKDLAPIRTVKRGVKPLVGLRKIQAVVNKERPPHERVS